MPFEERSSRVPELDGLRGLAILLVLFFHFAPGTPSFQPETVGAYVIAPFARVGWSGVDLFFVLSGFLITSVILKGASEPAFLRNFALRRATRILPVYALVIGFWLLGSLYLKDMAPRLFAPSPYWWSYLIFAQNDVFAFMPEINFASISWSVAIEIKFYILAFLFFGLALRRWPRFWGEGRIAILLLAVCALSLAARAAPLGSNTEAWRYFSTLTRLDALSLGSIACILLRTGTLPSRRMVIGALLLLSLLILVEVKWKGFWGPLTLTIFGLFYAGLLTLSLRGSSGLAVWQYVLRRRALMYCGTISYGLYFYHIPALGLATALFADADQDFLSPRPLFVTCIALAASFALAHLSWHFVEMPLLRSTRDGKSGRIPRVHLIHDRETLDRRGPECIR